MTDDLFNESSFCPRHIVFYKLSDRDFEKEAKPNCYKRKGDFLETFLQKFHPLVNLLFMFGL